MAKERFLSGNLLLFYVEGRQTSQNPPDPISGAKLESILGNEFGAK